MANLKKISNIEFNPMVESVSRKFARRIDKAYNTQITRSTDTVVVIPGTTYMGCSVRSANIVGFGPVKKNVMFFRRPTGYYQKDNSEDGINRRLWFSAASTWASARVKDLTHIAKDRQIWNQCVEDPTLRVNGIHASGYDKKDMRGWLFAIAYKYKANGQQIPSGDLAIDA